MATTPSPDPAAPDALDTQARAIWEANAPFWDAHMGEGNAFQRLLVGPATERLLGPRPGERALEIACGNGVMARRLARLGARVLATDASAAMIERARARGGAGIEYRVVDATDEAALLALGEASFDAALCGMAIMDLAAIAPMFRAARRLLTPEGRFVISTVHPCFNSGPIRRVVEEEDREGELTLTYGVLVRDYLRPSVAHGLAVRGQPRPQLYFHRPLSVILGEAFAAGFVLDGLEEPAFASAEEADHPLSWPRFAGIPPVLLLRLRAA